MKKINLIITGDNSSDIWKRVDVAATLGRILKSKSSRKLIIGSDENLTQLLAGLEWPYFDFLCTEKSTRFAGCSGLDDAIDLSLSQENTQVWAFNVPELLNRKYQHLIGQCLKFSSIDDKTSKSKFPGDFRPTIFFINAVPVDVQCFWFRPEYAVLTDWPWLPYLMWGLIGALWTGFDELHIANGVMNHSNNWVHQNFPWWFSPNYFVGGLLFYSIHRFFWPTQRYHALGGKIVPLWFFIKRCIIAAGLYVLTYFLCGTDHKDSPFPFLCGAICAAVAFYSIPQYQLRDPRLWRYLLICTTIGTGFEWLNSYLSFGFSYGVCPSRSCLGAPVALSWLPFLHMNAAVLVHVMIA